jgi:DNA-binding MarR family transcriptional regulator
LDIEYLDAAAEEVYSGTASAIRGAGHVNDRNDSAPVDGPPEVQEAVDAMSALIRSVDGFRHRAASGAHVGLTELRALGRINTAGRLSPKQLAQSLDLTTGTVTALLDRLERADLVTRIPHPHDRRMLLVELTPEGHVRLGAVLADWDGHVVAAADGMPPADLAATVRFLRRLGELIADAQSAPARDELPV